jgi:prephenate dehydrogenase
MTREIGIIGYGRFGKLAASHLKSYARLLLADEKRVRNPPRNCRIVTIEEASSCPMVILAVPINRMPSLLPKIAPCVRPGALICDVCSVKEKPVQWMMKYLPKHASILGLHPLFGPDSASDSLAHRNIVLCPGRIAKSRLREIVMILRKVKLNVFQMSPLQHDKLMASTLFLTQFVGHGLLRFGIPETVIRTQNFSYLQQIVLTSQHDSIELFRDMYHYNRFAKKIPKHLQESFRAVSKNISQREGI